MKALVLRQLTRIGIRPKALSVLANAAQSFAVIIVLALWVGVVSPSAELLPGLNGWGNDSVAISLQSAVLGIDSQKPTAEEVQAAALAVGLKAPTNAAPIVITTHRTHVATAAPAPRPVPSSAPTTPLPPTTTQTTAADPSPQNTSADPPSTPAPTTTPHPHTAPPPVALLAQTIHFTSTPPTNATVGGSSYAVSAVSDSGLSTVISVDPASTDVCAISSTGVDFSAAGTCTIDANQSGNSTYAPADQVQQSFLVSRNSQTVVFTTSAPAHAAVGAPRYNPSASSDSSLPVSLTLDPSSTGVCTMSNGAVSFVGTGTCTLLADQPGDTAYNPAATAQQSFTVARGDQTLTFTSTAPANATVLGTVYTPAAASNSGLPVSLSIDAASASVCAISHGDVTFTHFGTCTIDADQAGNGNWNPAPQAQQSIVVGRSGQAISFTSTAPASAVVNGSTYQPTATSDSGLAVSLSIDSSSAGICTISGGTVSFVGAGTCVVNADQAGDADYNPAPRVYQSFTVGRGSQTLSFTSTAPASATVAGATYTPTATSDSGLPVSLTVDSASTSVCVMSNGAVTFVAAGTCTIDADQAGDANYHAAPQVQQSFTVGRGSQTLSFTSTAPASATVAGATYAPTATSDSGLSVSLTVDSASSAVCAISGGTVSFTASGTCTIDANQPGNANYTAAAQVQQSFTVGRGSQTLSFTSTAPASATVAGATYTPTATSDSGLPVSLTVDSASTSVCAISGGTVSFTAAGTCTIDADQPGNANYHPAAQVQQSFTVAPGSQTLSLHLDRTRECSRERRDLHADGHFRFRPRRQPQHRLVERRDLHHLRRHRQLRRRRNLRRQRRPGRRRRLQPRPPRLPELHRRQGLAVDHLHLERAGRQHRWWRALHTDRHGRLGSPGDAHRRLGKHERLLDLRRQRQLRRRRHVHDRRRPVR